MVGVRCCEMLGFSLPSKPTKESTYKLVREIDARLDEVSFEKISANPDISGGLPTSLSVF